RMREMLRVAGGAGGLAAHQVVETVARTLRRATGSAPAGPRGGGARAAARAVPMPRATVDAGAHMFASTALWPCAEPGDLLISNGLATMGVALPAAIGAALQERSRPVVAFTGDGGLAMCLGELATAVEQRAPVIVVVFNDAALSLIDIKQQHRGLAATGVRTREADFRGVMRALGGQAWRAATAASLRAAVRRAHALASGGGGPCLIDVRVDPCGYRAQMRALRG
ncbi:MAG TPA: thiamine pyrophosphate-dependent enzyme, partial [Burkholderiaceae bacterium]